MFFYLKQHSRVIKVTLTEMAMAPMIPQVQFWLKPMVKTKIKAAQ